VWDRARVPAMIGNASDPSGILYQPLDVSALTIDTLKALLPLVIYVGLTVIRWIITGRWRLGPRW
jgi:hypothetical protein